MVSLKTVLTTIWLCIVIPYTFTYGQSPLHAAKTNQIPFKIERNMVIIPVRINGSGPFDLILDTGMGFDGVYMFHKEFTREIDTSGALEVRVPGAGPGEPSSGIMIENGILSFGDVVVDSQRVIIARSEYTQGFSTDGVIGWNLFGHYTVEINYDSGVIVLHDMETFQDNSVWQIIPITLKKNLPFFSGELEVIRGENLPVTLYIDLASDEALELLVEPGQKFTLPDSLEEDHLGTGLSGDIHGHRGRSKRLRLAGYDLYDIPTAFAPAKVRSKQEGADGILGGGFVMRFNIIFDYTNERLYMRPSKYFEVAFD
jgi:hypothetical protein